jgi:hypothetical protein
MEPPMIVLITSKRCGHCTAFRGDSGRPEPGRDWNYDYIRSLLNAYPSKTNPTMRRRVSSIVELHVETMDNTADNILEFNIYTAIPSVIELKRFIREHGITDYRFFQDVDVIGNHVERIGIRRGPMNTIDLSVDVDGSHSPSLTDVYMDAYVWSIVPEAIRQIREMVKSKTPVPDSVFSGIQDNQLQELLRKSYGRYKSDLKVLDQFLLTKYFTFSWLVSKLVVNQVRQTYEKYYPCWLLMSKSEWREGLDDPSKSVYARPTGHITMWDEARKVYVPTQYVGMDAETIDDVLNEYEQNLHTLSYVPTDEPVFSWTRRSPKLSRDR